MRHVLGVIVIPAMTMLATFALTGGAAHGMEIAPAAVQEAVEAVGAEARELRQPLPEGEVRVLQAVVMQVIGRAQWRPDDKAAWKPAAVNDMLAPGARIRTGRKSSVTLRVGLNATLRVDRNSRVVVPQIVQAGAILRTVTQLQRGRADFKVDRVGLTNDFSVVTPSSTLAVRGTAMTIEYGGLRGSEVRAAPTNQLRSIEMLYFVPMISTKLSKADRSTEQHPVPAVNDLFRTFGPPLFISAFLEAEGTPRLLAELFVGNPFGIDRELDTNAIRFAQALRRAADPGSFPDFPGFPDGPDIPDIPDIPDVPDFMIPGLEVSQFVQFMCDNLFEIFSAYETILNESGLPTGGTGGFFREPLSEMQQICQESKVYDEETLQELVLVIVSFCENHYDMPADISTCEASFGQAVFEVFSESGYPRPPQ